MTVLEIFLIVFLGVGPIVIGGATVTGQQERLCTALGGTWTPGPFGSNVCPGADIPVREPRQ